MAETYLGNPNLKKADVPVEFTKDQVEEYLKCMKDPVYFARQYVKIVNVDKGLIPFEMYDFQEEMVRTFSANRFSICKLPRQSGKSTTTTAYILHEILFKVWRSRRRFPNHKFFVIHKRQLFIK